MLSPGIVAVVEVPVEAKGRVEESEGEAAATAAWFEGKMFKSDEEEGRREAVVEVGRDAAEAGIGRGDGGTELRSGAICSICCGTRVRLALSSR